MKTDSTIRDALRESRRGEISAYYPRSFYASYLEARRINALLIWCGNQNFAEVGRQMGVGNNQGRYLTYAGARRLTWAIHKTRFYWQ